MSKLGGLLIAGLVCLVFASCDKDSDSIDCNVEGSKFDLNHTFDIQDFRTVVFEVGYSGTHTLDDTVAWTFGDGSTATGNGTTIQHTYTTSGTFLVAATVTVREGSKTCSSGVLTSVEVF